MLKIIILITATLLLSLKATPLLKTGQTKSYDTAGYEIIDGSLKDDGYYRAGSTRIYTRSGDIIRDNVTGLEWQDDVESIKKKWTNDNDPSDTAITYCSILNLDNGGWRLPSIEELETIVDDSKYNPSVTEGVFMHISSSYYWSSSTGADDANGAWYVDFSYGKSKDSYKFNYYYVRCVRGGQ